jgi:hypothetical protein
MMTTPAMRRRMMQRAPQARAGPLRRAVHPKFTMQRNLRFLIYTKEALTERLPNLLAVTLLASMVKLLRMGMAWVLADPLSLAVAWVLADPLSLAAHVAVHVAVLLHVVARHRARMAPLGWNPRTSQKKRMRS